MTPSVKKPEQQSDPAPDQPLHGGLHSLLHAGGHLLNVGDMVQRFGLDFLQSLQKGNAYCSSHRLLKSVKYQSANVGQRNIAQIMKQTDPIGVLIVTA